MSVPDPELPPLQRLRPFTPRAIACKICGGPARPFGAVDFSRSCEDDRGVALPRTGIDIHYRRCGRCGFLYTDAFDDWSPADFEAAIYNEGYAQVDPDYESNRPAESSKEIIRAFGVNASVLRVLDYAGGNGAFAQHLRAAGFPRVETYDPFDPRHRARPEGLFNVVTCFEAIEHMPDPAAGMAEIASFLAEDSVIVFSTVLQPANIGEVGMGWWYVGPRNGHISLFSSDALQRLGKAAGLTVISATNSVHVAYRKPPSFIQLRQP